MEIGAFNRCSNRRIFPCQNLRRRKRIYTHRITYRLPHRNRQIKPAKQIALRQTCEHRVVRPKWKGKQIMSNLSIDFSRFLGCPTDKILPFDHQFFLQLIIRLEIVGVSIRTKQKICTRRIHRVLDEFYIAGC